MQNSKTQTVTTKGVKDFYALFLKRNKKYRPQMFDTETKTKRRRKEAVPLRLYRKIILEFLKMYFFDLYTDNRVMYFPLGGSIKKVTYPKWTRWMAKGSSGKQKSGGENAIGLFWFLRPSKKMYYMVKLKKLTGSSNRLPQVEEMYRNNYNQDLLPIFKTELKKGQKHKTLYLCTLT